MLGPIVEASSWLISSGMIASIVSSPVFRDELGDDFGEDLGGEDAIFVARGGE